MTDALRDAEMLAFESWMRSDSTLPLDRGWHNYKDFNVALMWHAWEAGRAALAAAPAAPPVPATLGALMAVTAQCNRLKVALELACSHLTDAQAAEVAAAMPPEDAAAAQPVPATGAQPHGWISADSDQKPAIGQDVLLWVYAEKHGEDDDGNQYTQDVSSVHQGRFIDGVCGPYFDNYSTPFADVEGITHWMPLPTAPTGSATAPGQSNPKR